MEGKGISGLAALLHVMRQGCFFLTGFIPPFPCRLSPCEWNEPKNEENHFTFLNSLWFGAGALALQGELGGLRQRNSRSRMVL